MPRTPPTPHRPQKSLLCIFLQDKTSGAVFLKPGLKSLCSPPLSSAPVKKKQNSDEKKKRGKLGTKAGQAPLLAGPVPAASRSRADEVRVSYSRAGTGDASSRSRQAEGRSPLPSSSARGSFPALAGVKLAPPPQIPRPGLPRTPCPRLRWPWGAEVWARGWERWGSSGPVGLERPGSPWAGAFRTPGRPLAARTRGRDPSQAGGAFPGSGFRTATPGANGGAGAPGRALRRPCTGGTQAGRLCPPRGTGLLSGSPWQPGAVGVGGDGPAQPRTCKGPRSLPRCPHTQSQGHAWGSLQLRPLGQPDRTPGPPSVPAAVPPGKRGAEKCFLERNKGAGQHTGERKDPRPGMSAQKAGMDNADSQSTVFLYQPIDYSKNGAYSSAIPIQGFVLQHTLI
uniref:translation initiation factor IF-2-like n=1 Tax=Callithrix jacchus TaxID=9483 RepID=UPI0023DD2417|nr:translation initiation factor IF-2-like [Callithrix jacchus]